MGREIGYAGHLRPSHCHTENAMAHVVQFNEVGGPEKLEIAVKQIGEPGEGEVRIAVKAIGLNRAETLFRSGQYFEFPVFPASLGYEAAGIIEAVGPG